MVSRTTRKRIHQQIRIRTSITVLLCRKERSRETTPMPRLQISERIYEAKLVPLTTNIRSDDKAKRIKILYQIGYSMGIQQRSNKRRRPMESSLCNQSRIIRTKRNDVWIAKFTRNIPSDDGRLF